MNESCIDPDLFELDFKEAQSKVIDLWIMEGLEDSFTNLNDSLINVNLNDL